MPFPFKALARFADNLYRARELAGLDQKEAAKRAALTRSKLDKIEGGEYVPSLDVLIRLAGAYSTSVSDLVSGVTWRPGWVEHSGPAAYLVSEDKPAPPCSARPGSNTRPLGNPWRKAPPPTTRRCGSKENE